MSYNIIDILDKIIIIGEKRKDAYSNLPFKKSDLANIVIKVLIKSIDREILYYKNLKSNLDSQIVDDIEFVIYDKISFLINEFNSRLNCFDITNVNDLVHCALNMDKKIFALLIDIQGRLFKKEVDANTSTYKILSNMIKEKEKTINQISQYVK